MPDPIRVLVVDDDPILCCTVAEALADEGYASRTAGNGCEALGFLLDWEPHVVVLDLMMPVLDGRGFCEQQKSLDGRLAEVPVVVLSAAHDAAEVSRDLGAAACLAKPFDLDTLIATIERLASERQECVDSRSNGEPTPHHAARSSPGFVAGRQTVAGHAERYLPPVDTTTSP